eukprot:m.284734 g.284734  ORF g.284734 m.284734 type:complete len:74 (+) comp40680_c0_seq42:266-487(+)
MMDDQPDSGKKRKGKEAAIVLAQDELQALMHETATKAAAAAVAEYTKSLAAMPAVKETPPVGERGNTDQTNGE